ncbi:MAG: glycosyltransferase family 4 protein [Planctomycetota bacterium]
MKIALNIEFIGSRRGGAEKYAGMLARWLGAAGHEVHAFAREIDDGELPPGGTFHPVRPKRTPGLGWLRSLQFGHASANAIRDARCDLSIGFVKSWNVDAYIAVGGAHPASLLYNSRRFRHPLVRVGWWITKFFSPKQWVFRAIERRQFGNHSPFVIAPAQMVADHFQRFHGIKKERMTVVPNGIASLPSDESLRLGRARFRSGSGIRPDQVAILFAAHNFALKGLHPLLLAFSKIARRCPQATLLVCGSKQDLRYRRLARSLGILDQTRFLGFVDDIRDAFAGADLFAFPTFYDPCSLVIPEAMAAGLPVITTRQNGATDLIVEGETGFIIDQPWSIDTFADRFECLLGNDSLRHRMGKQARMAARQFTLDVRMPQLLQAIERAHASKNDESRSKDAPNRRAA